LLAIAEEEMRSRAGGRPGGARTGVRRVIRVCRVVAPESSHIHMVWTGRSRRGAGGSGGVDLLRQDRR